MESHPSVQTTLKFQAKFHVNSLNMKVRLPQNEGHKWHMDSKFCFQAIEHYKQRVVLCGSNHAIIESVDDKAKVNINEKLLVNENKT